MEPRVSDLSLSQLLRCLGQAQAYDLEQPRFEGMPNHPGNSPAYQYSLHTRHERDWPESRTEASGIIVTSEHAGTHLDAPCHIADRLALFRDIPVTPAVQTARGLSVGGAETIPPLLGRGVLLDIASHLAVDRVPPRYLISSSELQAAAEAQGTSIDHGDVVLVRTGYGALWDEPAEYLDAGGVGVDATEWLAGVGVRAVGADNVAWEVPGVKDPQWGTTLPGHIVLLVRHGIVILENLFLEELAGDRRYEFCLACFPLKLRGATGSPVRPIALGLR